MRGYGRNIIRQELQGEEHTNRRVNFFGEGNAAEKIVNIVEKKIGWQTKELT